MKDSWVVKARESQPLLLLNGLAGEPDGDWCS